MDAGSTGHAAGAPSPWILGDLRRDLAWLFLPGLAILLLNLFIKETPGSKVFAAYFFFDSCFMGSGHIYATGWRTYMNPDERKRFRMYLIAPLACFTAFFSWRYFDIHFLLYVPAYAQFWHYMRQSFGIQKWYQKQNGRFDRASDWLVQFLCTMPFVIFHFRPRTELTSFFLPDDLLLSPNERLKNIALVIYAAGLIVWIGHELTRLKYREWNRLGYIALSVFLNGICLLTGRNEMEILFPLVAYHGLSYIGLTSMAMTKTRANVFTTKRALMYLALTALFFGTYERIIQFSPGGGVPLFVESLWAGLYVTPILLHYIFDAYLWRARHPEAALVYGALTRPTPTPTRAA